MERKVNVGFIGAGSFISRHHLPTAGKSKVMKIRAIADLNQELLNAHAEKYAPDYTTDDYKQLLNDPEIDLIVIGTRQDTHAALIIEALDSGKWVWCEKPMCETREEEELIIAAEKRAKGRLAIGFNRRFAPAVQKCRQVMFEKLPKPWIVNYRLQENGGYKTSKTDKFYHQRAHIIYEGCHHLDLANYLFGTLPERVFMSGTYEDENDICILEYADGSRFILTITTNAGSAMLEKESMEVFSQGGALSMRDFVELRIRGIKGETDCIFPPENLPWGELVTKYGYDCWESLFSRLIEPDMSAGSSLVPTVVAQSEKVFASEVDAIGEKMKDTHWLERNFTGDKGWIDALEHFALCCRDKSIPETADGLAGKSANELAFALLESKQSGMPVRIKK